MYAQQINGDWREVVGNIVFSPTVYQTPESLSDEQRAEFGVFEIVEMPRPSLTPSQKFGDPSYAINGVTVQRTYPAVDKTPEEIAASQAQQEQSVRTMRQTKLEESDWTQLPDTPADKALWATYRQELRDVTSQAGFPWDVQWPVAPA